MLFLPATLLAALPILFTLFVTAHADHHVCGYMPNETNDPASHGFTKFCDTVGDGYLGPGIPNGGAYAQWHCNNTDILVADWSVLREGILECATPCNGGGYAKKTACGFSTWSVCISGGAIGRNTIVCHLLNQWDDCEWPREFLATELPTTLTVWHK